MSRRSTRRNPSARDDEETTGYSSITGGEEVIHIQDDPEEMEDDNQIIDVQVPDVLMSMFVKKL